MGKWQIETGVNALQRAIQIRHETNAPVGIRTLSENTLIWRTLEGGESVFDRLPIEDGIDHPEAGPQRRKGTSKYPWKEWMDGKYHIAKQGVDFTCTPNGFMQYLRNKSHSAGLGVRAFERNDRLYGEGTFVVFCFHARGTKLHHLKEYEDIGHLRPPRAASVA